MKKFNFNIDIEDNIQQLSKSPHGLISQMNQYEINQHLVDMNLPSGTLWCKYNLGVNLSNLSEARDWYGDYYAWGELKTKEIYTWDNYKHISTRRDEIVFPKYGEDHVMELQLEDDVAYQKLHIGKLKFRIPSRSQFEELLKNSTNDYIKDFNDIKGLNGRLLKSKLNGNEIFFPFAGVNERSQIYEKSKLNGVGSTGIVWTSTVDSDPSRSWYVNFDFDSIGVWRDDKYIGCSIRPILFNE